jgi:hypothetical protein
MANPPSFRGKLQGFSTFPDDLPGGQFRRNWRLKIEFGPADPPIDLAFTNSRIVLAVLNTALLMAAKWEVEITLTDTRPPTITRVRVYDDREDICTGGGN